MTRGILLFAFEGGFDYLNLAVICAKRIKQYMDLPISLVTDNKQQFVDKFADNLFLFDEIIELQDDTVQYKRFHNGVDSEVYVWKNTTRVYSYDVTPYDHTLVLDTDFIISSNFLENCFAIDSDFLIYKDFKDLSNWRSNYSFEYISNFSIPFYWATVFMFKKNNKNKIFFDLLKHIKTNWDYYRLIYQISDSKFRNDYAFSIAIHIFSGYIGKSFVGKIPGKIYFTKDTDFLYSCKNNSLTLLVQKEHSPQEYVPIKVNNLDVHIMNKFSLLENLK